MDEALGCLVVPRLAQCLDVRVVGKERKRRREEHRVDVGVEHGHVHGHVMFLMLLWRRDRRSAVGIDYVSLMNLGDDVSKIELIYQWIQNMITDNFHSEVITMPAPIVSRIFQESHGPGSCPLGSKQE